MALNERMAAQSSTARSHAYLTALTGEIEKKLHRAVANPSHSPKILQDMFADVALEVDDRAQDILIREDEDAILSEASRGPVCFYDVLSDHFVLAPEDGRPILEMIVKLWSQSFASHIFALLFHKWLFEVEIESSEVLLRYSSALVQGSTNIFWQVLLIVQYIMCRIVLSDFGLNLRVKPLMFEGLTSHCFRMDVQTNTRHFMSLFLYLLNNVALDHSRLSKIAIQAQRSLFLLISRFIFFYQSADKLPSFLDHFPTFPNSFLIGGAGDIFVIEITDQLQKLKVEPVLLHYLSQIKCLQGLELRMTTSTRLKACLYSFTSPGGPMYPTRAVRHAAWDTLDSLFPVGQYPRHLISLFFRLLYPWYWPFSCWNFIVSCIKAVLYSVLNILVSSWENLTRPKRS